MKPLDKWLYADEASLHEATMLILDIEPHRFENEEDKFESVKYEQIYASLKTDIKNGTLKNNNPTKPSCPGDFEPYISLDNLKSWVLQNYICAPFFARFEKNNTYQIPENNFKEPQGEQDYQSRELNILNDAAFQWWSSVDKDDKTTHPTNKQVRDWLEKQGYSKANAKQGAVIIRPEWAAIGRRPTE